MYSFLFVDVFGMVFVSFLVSQTIKRYNDESNKSYNHGHSHYDGFGRDGADRSQ